jgi:hypothetical protein
MILPLTPPQMNADRARLDGMSDTVRFSHVKGRLGSWNLGDDNCAPSGQCAQRMPREPRADRCYNEMELRQCPCTQAAISFRGLKAYVGGSLA